MENIIQIILKDMNKTNERIKENEKKYNESLNSFATIIEELIKKVKKITLILSISTILNSIAIIILNLWR